MIKRITKIEDFGILHQPKAATELQPFNKFNIIYGWNGSGKTTLGRLLRCLETKCNHKEFEGARYQVELHDGSKIDSDKIEHTMEIRMFNQDFISENLNLFDAKTNAIIFISKEKVDEKKEYDEKKIELKKKKDERQALISKKVLKETAVDKTHQDAGRVIKNFLLGTIYANVTYNKASSRDKIWPDVSTAESIRTFILSNEQLTHQKGYVLENSEKAIIDLGIAPQPLSITKLEEIEKQISASLMRGVTSKVIERLRDRPDVNDWVKKGLQLHRDHDNTHCDFCGNTINDTRIQELDAHFSKEYDELVLKLENLVEAVSKGIRLEITNQRHLLYEEIQAEYDIAVTFLNAQTQEVNKHLNQLIELLQQKLKNPFSIVEAPASEFNIYLGYNEGIAQLVQVLESHNNLSSSQKKLAEAAKGKIEKHFVSKQAIADGLSANEGQINSLSTSITDCDKAIGAIVTRLRFLEDELKSDTIAITQINDSLHKFLGRNDIVLERHEQGGYQLKRNGVLARNLSEGEKTAISLIYFFSKIQENDAEVKNLIIGVDDPVSSFDSNHLFNASAFIKNIIDKAQQIFVLTHNFWFFKQVRDWMLRKNDKKDSNGKQIILSHLYQVERGHLKNATQPLVRFHSEYQHVFGTLLSYQQSGACDDAACFGIANAARRLLEGFTSFKTPDNANFNGALQIGMSNGMDIAAKERIFYFLNKYSHLDRIESFDTTIETLLEEGKNVVDDILKLIKLADKDHYHSMLKVCGYKDALIDKVHYEKVKHA